MTPYQKHSEHTPAWAKWIVSVLASMGGMVITVIIFTSATTNRISSNEANIAQLLKYRDESEPTRIDAIAKLAEINIKIIEAKEKTEEIKIAVSEMQRQVNDIHLLLLKTKKQESENQR